jgi:hypothetical protein
MASPLSLLEPDAKTPTPSKPSDPSIPIELSDGTEPTTEYRRYTPQVDSGVLTRASEQSHVAISTSTLSSNNAVHILTERQPVDSLKPTAAFTQRIPHFSHMHWVGIGLLAALVTVAVMATADRLWPPDTSHPVAQPIVERTTQVPVSERPRQQVKEAEKTANSLPVAPSKAPVADASAANKSSEGADKTAVETSDALELERLIRIALRDGNAGLAVKYAEKLVFAKPRRARYRLLYGDALVARGDTQAALTQYRLAAETAPRSRQVRYRLEKYGKHE